MNKWYTELDKKFSWSFFGFVLGIIGIVFGIYTYFNKANPEIQFQLLTNTNVLDIKENVGNLAFYNDNTKLNNKDSTLKILTVKVVNNSGYAITKNFYDENSPLGIEIKNYQIASV